MSSSSSVNNQLKQVFTNLEGLNAGDADANYNKIVQAFNQAIIEAQSNFIDLKGGKDFVLTTILDKRQSEGGEYIVDGGADTDTLLVDNYRIANPSDIQVQQQTFIDSDGNKRKGFLVTIKGVDANGAQMAPRNYKLMNIENLVYVDAAGNKQTLQLKTSVDEPSSSNANYAPKSYKGGVPKFSDGADVVTVTGAGRRLNETKYSADDTIGVSFNMGKGNDTAIVAGLSKLDDLRYVDQINGGSGVDTIEFNTITEADISKIVYDNSSNNYRLYTKDGGNIQFKAFEKIKIGNNIYDIPPRSNKTTLEEIFSGGKVKLLGKNNS